MVSNFVKTVVVLLVLVLSGCLLMGCSMFDSHAKQMDIINGLAVQVTKSMGDGAIAHTQLSAQGINPGIEITVSQSWSATGRYVGIAGQMMAAQSGPSHPVTTTQEAKSDAILTDTSDRNKATGGSIVDIITGAK